MQCVWNFGSSDNLGEMIYPNNLLRINVANYSSLYIRFWVYLIITIIIYDSYCQHHCYCDYHLAALAL